MIAPSRLRPSLIVCVWVSVLVDEGKKRKKVCKLTHTAAVQTTTIILWPPYTRPHQQQQQQLHFWDVFWYCCCCLCCSHSTMLVADGNAHFILCWHANSWRRPKNQSNGEMFALKSVRHTISAGKKGTSGEKKNGLFLRFVKLLVVLYWYARHLLFLLNVMFSTGFLARSLPLTHSPRLCLCFARWRFIILLCNSVTISAEYLFGAQFFSFSVFLFPKKKIKT